MAYIVKKFTSYHIRLLRWLSSWLPIGKAIARFLCEYSGPFRGMLSKIVVGIYNIQHTYGSLTGVSGRVAIVNQVFREAVV